MLILWTILKSRVTWYVLAAVLAVALLLGLRSHYIDQGKQQGQQQQKQSQQQDIETEREAAQADAKAKVADANARAEEANARAGAAQLQAATYALQVQRLTGQLTAARRAVDSLPDNQVHPHVVAALGLRAPGDATPGYTPPEEREIARRVDAAPILQQQNDALAGQVGKLAENVSALSDQVRAVKDAQAAQDAYTVRLEGWYTQLYNLHPPKARAGKCLWLWKCGEHKLPVPAPKDLHK